MIQPDDIISIIRSVSGTWHLDQPDMDTQGKAITVCGRLIKFKFPDKYRIKVVAADPLPSYKICCECPWPYNEAHHKLYTDLLISLGVDPDNRAPMDGETHLEFLRLYNEMSINLAIKWRR